MSGKRCVAANATLLSYGFQSGWLSPTTKLLQSEQSPAGRPLTDNEISWIGSLPSLASVIGVPLFTVTADKFGRKPSVIVIIALQGEISQDDIRGTLGSMFVLIQNIGVLLMYAMGAYLDYYTVLWIVTAVPLIAGVCMLKAPESPAFLMKLGKVEEATSVIAFFRGLSTKDAPVQEAMDAIKYEDNYFKSIPNVSFFNIFKEKAWCRGFLIMTAIFFAHATNGAFSIVTYATTILKASGVTTQPELQSLSLPVCMILGSLVSMSCVDRLGRKPILAAAFIGSVVCLLSLAGITIAQRAGGAVPAWLPIVTICMCLGVYAGGVSPMPYVILSEMFNFQIRTKVVGCVVTFTYAMLTIQLGVVGQVMTTYGAHVAFLGFAAINALGAVLTLTILPETKAKSVAQIEQDLKKM